MMVTVVMAQHSGDDEIQEVFVFAGVVRDEEATDRAVAQIASDMLGKGNENSDLWPTAATAIDHVREVVTFTIKTAELRV